MNIVFMNECAVDGCYKKRKEKSSLCKEHYKDYYEGKVLSVYYGKKMGIHLNNITKTGNEQINQQLKTKGAK